MKNVQYLARPNQKLIDHCNNVMDICSYFAPDNVKNICKFLGFVHDYGKWNGKWQTYLRNSMNGVQCEQVNHSPQSAFFVSKLLRDHIESNKLCAMVNIVLSHHSGLHDDIDECGVELICDCPKLVDIDDVPIDNEYKNFCDKAQDLAKNAVSELNNLNSESGFYWAMWVKTIYSIVCDSDRLDSAGFNVNDLNTNFGNAVSIGDFKSRLTNYILDNFKSSSYVNEQRTNIRNECVRQGKCLSSGTYGLTTPTGTGKTISVLSFAFEQAVKDGKDRIIVVEPLNSINNQVSDVVKSILGDDGFYDYVCQDYSSIDQTKRAGYCDEYRGKSAYDMISLDKQRWSSPIIVTSLVNILMIIANSHPSKARKLHSLYHSVVVFDEIQQLPTEYISMFNDFCNFLRDCYDCTVVVCTASSPVLDDSRFEHPLKLDIKNLVDESKYDKSVFDGRVEYVYHSKMMGVESIVDLISQEIKVNDNFIAIVNTRNECKSLCAYVQRKLPDCEVCLLSRDLIGKDIEERIAYIKSRLLNRSGKKFIVIATCLVEAGVDVDFDCGLRYMGGEHNIVQSGGRLNRHGKRVAARMHIIDADGKLMGSMKTCKDAFISKHEKYPNSVIGSAESFAEYSRVLYFGVGECNQQVIDETNETSKYPIDGGKAYDLLGKFDYDFDDKYCQFETVSKSKAARVIDDTFNVDIVVQCDDVIKKAIKDYIELKEKSNETCMDMRVYTARLCKCERIIGKYTVSIFGSKSVYECLKDIDAKLIRNNTYVVDEEYYSNEFGLDLDASFESVLIV